MKSHLSTEQKLDALEAAALNWEGRLERRCQFAMAGIYQEALWLPAGLEIPNGNRDWAKSEGVSLITPWVEGSGFFDDVSSGYAAAGDLLGFRLGHTLHHVAVKLSGGRMVHVFGEHGVKIAPCIPLPWLRRVEKIWRPKYITGGLEP